MSIEVVETHMMLPDIVSPGSIVVDCGANIGRFSLEMIRRFGCLCYAFGCLCYAIEAALDTFCKIPTTTNLQRYNFALCATNKLVMMSIDEDIARSTKKIRVAVQGRHFGV